MQTRSRNHFDAQNSHKHHQSIKKKKNLPRKLEGINIIHTLSSKWASLVAQLIKNLPAM